MTRKSFVLELGSGADLRGGDSTKAAVKAVKDAIYDGSLFVLEYVDSFDKVLVDVTIGVPDPDSVRVEEVLAALPVGKKTIHVIEGGMAVPYHVGEGEEQQYGKTDMVIIANAAVRVSLEL
jgi:uncharacterized protein (TIGR02058 family)